MDKDPRNEALALARTSATEVRIVANKKEHSKLWKFSGYRVCIIFKKTYLQSPILPRKLGHNKTRMPVWNLKLPITPRL